MAGNTDITIYFSEAVSAQPGKHITVKDGTATNTIPVGTCRHPEGPSGCAGLVQTVEGGRGCGACGLDVGQGLAGRDGPISVKPPVRLGRARACTTSKCP